MSEETTRQRIRRERNERIARKTLERFALRMADQKDGLKLNHRASTTSTKREAELQRVYNELKAPEAKPITEKKVTQEVGGTPVTFYVYKDGVLGTMDLTVQKGFTEL